MAVTVNIPQEADINWGDQAGVVLYSSDTEWVKLVLEGDKVDGINKTRGSRMIVLAYMPSNADSVSKGGAPEVCVCRKWDNLGTDPQPRRLQLELRRARECCSVMASWDGIDAVEMRMPLSFECPRLGVMAHLDKEKAPSPREGWFHFSEFSGDGETAAAERVGR